MIPAVFSDSILSAKSLKITFVGKYIL